MPSRESPCFFAAFAISAMVQAVPCPLEIEWVCTSSWIMMITSLPGDDAVDCPDKVSCSPKNMLPDNSMRPNLWFVNEKNKKPQKMFRKPKKHSKKYDYFIDFI